MNGRSRPSRSSEDPGYEQASRPAPSLRMTKGAILALCTFVAFLFAPSTFAQILTSTARGVVVAHDGRIELTGGWSMAGVKNATSILSSPDQVAVLDALNNEAVVIELATGRARRFATGETPIDAAFLGRDLYVLARDAQQIERLGPSPSLSTVLRTDPDPAFLRGFNNNLYVYSRATGAVESLRGGRVAVAPFASDFEIAGSTGYLVFPREALIRTIDLRTMKRSGEIKVGAVPVDLAFAGGGTAMTARVLAVADPSAKRVWLTEGVQSTTEAIARGFVRGLLGLGLYGARSSQFPTGIDRVLANGKTWIAYDTSSGSLFRFSKNKSTLIARGVAPRAFAVTADGVVYWLDGRVRMAR